MKPNPKEEIPIENLEVGKQYLMGWVNIFVAHTHPNYFKARYVTIFRREIGHKFNPNEKDYYCVYEASDEWKEGRLITNFCTYYAIGSKTEKAWRRHEYDAQKTKELYTLCAQVRYTKGKSKLWKQAIQLLTLLTKQPHDQS